MSTYTVRSTRTGVHIAGIAEEITTGEFNYSLSACPALSRTPRMAIGRPFEDIADALAEARLTARVSNRKMCKTCEHKAMALLPEAPAAEPEATPAPAEAPAAAPVATTATPMPKVSKAAARAWAKEQGIVLTGTYVPREVRRAYAATLEQ